jgi:hypothetical protein
MLFIFVEHIIIPEGTHNRYNKPDDLTKLLKKIIDTMTLLLYCYSVYVYCIYELKEFEDTKGVIRIRISKKNRQHNGQKKKDKRTNHDQQKTRCASFLVPPGM